MGLMPSKTRSRFQGHYNDFVRTCELSAQQAVPLVCRWCDSFDMGEISVVSPQPRSIRRTPESLNAEFDHETGSRCAMHSGKR